MSRSGEGKIGCIIWLVLLAMFVTVCWKAVPVKIRSAELEDYMEEQGKFAGRASPAELHRRILRRARELRLPVDEDELTIEKYGGRVRMEVRYTVQLEFPFYTHNWNFHHIVDLPVFLM